MMLTHLRCSIAALALLAAGAACSGQSPTAVRDAEPATPRRDSGVMFGSGNFVGGTSTTTTTSGGVTFGSGNRLDEENTTAADSGSAATNRGGLTFGSGA